MSNILLVIAALTGAQAWTAWAYMGVHGGEYLVSEHTALVVQCNEEREEILVTVHVPHDEEDGRAVLKHRTLYVQMDGGEVRAIEKTEDRPFPGVFQFAPEEWFVDFLLDGGSLEAVFDDARLQVPVDGAFMMETLDHCTGGTHVHE